MRRLGNLLTMKHITKYKIYKPESVLKNEMNKIFCYFKIQTGHLISARRPAQGIIDKKREFAV